MRVAGLGEAAEALGGTSVSDGSLAAWRDCSEVVVCLDGDEAGLEGLKRIMKLLPRAEGLPPVSVVLLPPDSDLDEVLREDATTAWSEFLGARTPWLTFVVRAELEPVRGEGDESVALRRVGAVCKASVAGWPSEVGVALREAAKMVGIDERFLARVYDKVQSP
jgi:DNA primase